MAELNIEDIVDIALFVERKLGIENIVDIAHLFTDPKARAKYELEKEKLAEDLEGVTKMPRSKEAR